MASLTHAVVLLRECLLSANDICGQHPDGAKLLQKLSRSLEALEGHKAETAKQVANLGERISDLEQQLSVAQALGKGACLSAKNEAAVEEKVAVARQPSPQPSLPTPAVQSPTTGGALRFVKDSPALDGIVKQYIANGTLPRLPLLAICVHDVVCKSRWARMGVQMVDWRKVEDDDLALRVEIFACKRDDPDRREYVTPNVLNPGFTDTGLKRCFKQGVALRCQFKDVTSNFGGRQGYFKAVCFALRSTPTGPEPVALGCIDLTVRSRADTNANNQLPLQRAFKRIGPHYASKLQSLGITTIEDLAGVPLPSENPQAFSGVMSATARAKGMLTDKVLMKYIQQARQQVVNVRPTVLKVPSPGPNPNLNLNPLPSSQPPSSASASLSTSPPPSSSLAPLPLPPPPPPPPAPRETPATPSSRVALPAPPLASCPQPPLRMGGESDPVPTDPHLAAACVASFKHASFVEAS